MPRLLEEKLLEEGKDYQRNFRVFLAASTIRDDSNPSAIKGEEGLLRRIRSFLRPKRILGADEDCTYKIQMDFCDGTEHCHADALEGCGFYGDESDDYITNKNKRSGSLLSFPLISRFTLNQFFHEGGGATLRNKDGSYYSNMQLREAYYSYNRIHCCGSPHGACRGKCGALPGDTIEWIGYYSSRIMTGFQPATLDELVERKWETNHPHHAEPLKVVAEMIRNQDPNELKEMPWKGHIRLWGGSVPHTCKRPNCPCSSRNL